MNYLEYIELLPDWASDMLGLELPQQETLDAYVDYILPKIYYLGEDLKDTEYYVDHPWKEIRQDADFHEHIVHIFKRGDHPFDVKSKAEDDGPDYMRLVNGEGPKGKWMYVSKTNLLLIKQAAVPTMQQALNSFESFQLVFLNDDFFIIKRYGSVARTGEAKYIILGKEARVRNI
ncbi:MAG: hypothetical protein RI894_1846, partial [Bacteroidota bacterium]